MTAIKESSTQQLNKQLQNVCPVTYTLEKIGAKWKPLILYQLMDGSAKRYGQIRKAVPGITEKMLIQHLRELESDGLIIRDVKPVVPPHVEYRMSADGITLTPILNAMAEWGLARRGE
jgi:DNA-binding HxlR family transcriptional regulator